MFDKIIEIEDLGNAKLETRQFSPYGPHPDSQFGKGELYG
jgi:hypothetical protein